MVALIHPVLFSQHFDCSADKFEDAGLIEPILNCDTKLFVDPTLIKTSSNSVVAELGYHCLTGTYSKIIRLLKASNGEYDVGWKGARKLLNLDEYPGTHLGYGSSRTTGSSRPISLRDDILRTAMQIIEIGETDPDLLSLVGLFEEGVGPDAIGDFTCHCISESIVQISADFYKKHKLPTVAFPEYGGAELVVDPFEPDNPVILVPTDIVRDLPLASDWGDVYQAISEIEEIRDRFDKFFIATAKPTITEKRMALKEIALSSKEIFRSLLNGLMEYADNYDPNDDIFNYYNLRAILGGSLNSTLPQFIGEKPKSLDDLYTFVIFVVSHFQSQVEHNNLWELFWNKNRAKPERASQLVFYAIADVFCKLNNVDITPEGNMGGGPVDFKFSKGYDARVVVEMKKSTGTVVHGYEKQLEKYKMAASTDRGVFVIMDIGRMGKKLQKIKKLQEYRLIMGEVASEIIVVDARRKKSASVA